MEIGTSRLKFRINVVCQGWSFPLTLGNGSISKTCTLNFYNRKARGMLAMIWPLKITVAGNHHLGIDDATNIARVLQRMIIDGAVLQISARRKNDGKCEFLRVHLHVFFFSKRTIWQNKSFKFLN